LGFTSVIPIIVGLWFLIKSLSSDTLFVKQSAFVYVHKIGRGCAVYVKNNVQANHVEFSSKFQESVWISVKLVGGDELLVGCIYRSK
jgi:hypothetical protein